MKTYCVLACLLFFALNGNAQVAKDSTIFIDKNKTGTDSIYTSVEQEATFPGGNAAWIRYLQLNLDPMVPVKHNAPDGSYQVIVRFIVRKDGSFDNVVAETSFGYGMEEEAIRIIKKGPKWVPANKNGHNVDAYRKQPVTFVLQGY